MCDPVCRTFGNEHLASVGRDRDVDPDRAPVSRDWAAGFDLSLCDLSMVGHVWAEGPASIKKSVNLKMMAYHAPCN